MRLPLRISGPAKRVGHFLWREFKDDAPTLLAVGAVQGGTIRFTGFVEDYAAIRIHSRSTRKRLEYAVHPAPIRPGREFESSPSLAELP